MSDIQSRIAARRKVLAAKGDFSSIGERIAARRAQLELKQPADVSHEALDRAANADQIAEDRMTLSQTPKALQALSKFNQGLPFVGEYMDEAADLISPGAGELMRDTNNAFERESPKTAMGLKVAGGVAGSVPLAVGGAGLVMKAPGVLGKGVAATAGAGAVGGLEGGAAGFGRGRTRAERLSSAKDDAILGAGLGVAAGALAPVIGKSAKEIYRRAKSLDVATIAQEFGMSRQAATVVKKALAAGDFDAVSKNLNIEGAMLADANQATGQLLDAASATGGRALQITRDAVDGRANQAGKNLNSTFDRILGKPEGVRAQARGIAQRTSGTRKAAYDNAYSQPIDYSGKGRNVEAVLQRIPPKTLQGAVAEANEAMLEAGTSNQQIMASIGDDGAVVFSEMPNVQQLDQIKRALGDIAEKEVDQFGRKTAAGLRANRLAGDLRDAIGEAVPAFKRAVRLGGDKIAEDKALDVGQNLLTNRVKFEDVADAMRGASVDQKAAIARGLRENIENTLSQVKRTITDPNTDAREAMQLVKDFSSRANKRKLVLAIGSKKTKELLREVDKATAALELRAMVATNSKTAVRGAVQDQIEEVTAPGIISQAASGEVVGSGKQVIQALTGATGEMRNDQKQAIFEEIATALTSIRGPKASRAMGLVRKAMKGQPLKDDQANFVARLFGGGSGALAYQVGTQVLGQP